MIGDWREWAQLLCINVKRRDLKYDEYRYTNDSKDKTCLRILKHAY